MIIGIVCGTLAALAWAGGFVVAKHGIQIGLYVRACVTWAASVGGADL